LMLFLLPHEAIKKPINKNGKILFIPQCYEKYVFWVDDKIHSISNLEEY